MSENYAIQYSVKTPRDSMLNLRADTKEEFELLAAWALQNSARFLDLETAIKGVPQALAGNVTSVSVQTTQPQGQPLGNEPTGPAPMCAHGPKNFKSGIAKSGKNAGKRWQAWDCPQGVCEREWVR